MTLYDSHGKPVAYIYEDNVHIYLFNGQPVAYLYGDAVYGFNGHQLGWFEDGWVRDLYGKCVFFTENATGSGPAKPIKHARPIKGVRHVKPVKCSRHAKVAKAAKSLAWSGLSGEHFFEQ